MKKKGFIILGATSLVALSVLTLTSCGNKKNINFKSYSNKVSEKQFGDKLDELQEKAHVKVGDSYEGASYFFIESSASGAGESASSSSYKYVEEKYNSDDQILNIFFAKKPHY